MHRKVATTKSIGQNGDTSLDDAYWDDALWPVTQAAHTWQTNKDRGDLLHPSHLPESNSNFRPFNVEFKCANTDERPPLMSG